MLETSNRISRNDAVAAEQPTDLDLEKRPGVKGQASGAEVIAGPHRGSGFDPLQVALQNLNRKVEGAVAEIQEVRTFLADPKHRRDEQRLQRIEEAVQEITTSNDSIAEMMRSFEAMISIGLVQRLNDLVEERLVVVSAAIQRLQTARRHRTSFLLLSLGLGALLGLEMYDGRVAVALNSAWSNVLPAIADMGDWIDQIAG